ncbi:MAG: TadE/TadG family type IV pilus assembly protein [Planctomycetaceae bacterium]
MRPSRPQRARRRGVLSMELVFTLPILGVLLAGLLEFSVLFFARADVVEACRAGARKATLYGVTQIDVENEIRRVLAPRLQRGMRVTTKLNVGSGDLVTVSVSTPMSTAAPDLLWPIGFSLQGRNLYCQTRMAKE